MVWTASSMPGNKLRGRGDDLRLGQMACLLWLTISCMLHKRTT